MPNYCECDLRVRGPETDVEAFLQHAAGKIPVTAAGTDAEPEDKPTMFDFDRFVPMPNELEMDAGSTELLYTAKYGSGQSITVDGYQGGGYVRCRRW